jgi:hypothetical protein
MVLLLANADIRVLIDLLETNEYAARASNRTDIPLLVSQSRRLSAMMSRECQRIGKYYLKIEPIFRAEFDWGNICARTVPNCYRRFAWNNGPQDFKIVRRNISQDVEPEERKSDSDSW